MSFSDFTSVIISMDISFMCTRSFCYITLLLLQCLLYGSGLKPNPQYFQGMPVCNCRQLKQLWWEENNFPSLQKSSDPEYCRSCIGFFLCCNQCIHSISSSAFYSPSAQCPHLSAYCENFYSNVADIYYSLSIIQYFILQSSFLEIYCCKFRAL